MLEHKASAATLSIAVRRVRILLVRPLTWRYAESNRALINCFGAGGSMDFSTTSRRFNTAPPIFQAIAVLSVASFFADDGVQGQTSCPLFPFSTTRIGDGSYTAKVGDLNGDG